MVDEPAPRAIAEGRSFTHDVAAHIHSDPRLGAELRAAEPGSITAAVNVSTGRRPVAPRQVDASIAGVYPTLLEDAGGRRLERRFILTIPRSTAPSHSDLAPPYASPQPVPWSRACTPAAPVAIRNNTYA
jgi:hypothetical protein